MSLLKLPRLWIPNTVDYSGHLDWSDQAGEDIWAGGKRPIACWMDEEPAGIGLYQRHKTRPHTVEVKYLSVLHWARGQLIGAFILRQIEIAIREEYPDCTMMVADVKRSRRGIIAFVLSQGWTIEQVTILPGTYPHNGSEDVVVTKSLITNKPRLLMP